jgi:predicted ATPase/class 3 adenylate cyclase
MTGALGEDPAEAVTGALPSGTVTLLFSDMEGSTKLVGRLGADYATALDQQRRIQRACWSRHAGVELGTEGDSFFVAFHTAADAVRAAVEAQLELEHAVWPGQEPVRVRMGIHTGSPVVHDGGYVGMDVHRAARVAGTAHGGQIVLSEVTARLVDQVPDLSVVDLGEHTLKDLPLPERLHQVAAPGLATGFPPLRSMGSPTRIPVPTTSLLGRDGEVAELTAALDRHGTRLVTLTGPGGTGKTRLAIAVAAARPASHPVFFVPLESVTRPDSMWTTIATAFGVPPQARQPPALLEHLAHSTALLVLDNLEQIPAAGDVVAALLDAAVGIQVLATSRYPLHVQGEHEHAVPPLELPRGGDADGEEIAASGAVQLFVQHAQMVRRDFRLTRDNQAAVAAICRRLDGLPLALELAAARVKLLSPQALATRMDTALDIKTSDGRRPGRQQTLRQAIAWSYDLLDPGPQSLLRILSGFADGASLDALESVATRVGLEADVFTDVEILVDASLATVAEADGEPRIHLLNTIRAFAQDQVRHRGEDDRLRTTVARWAWEFLDSLPLDERDRAIRLVEVEYGNLRDIMTWLPGLPPGPADSPDPVTMALEMSYPLGWLYCQTFGYHQEALTWCTAALAAAGDRSDQHVATGLAASALLARLGGDLERALRDIDAAVRILTMPVGDHADHVRRERLASARHERALILTMLGDLEGARTTFDSVVVADLPPYSRYSLLLRRGILDSVDGRPEDSMRWEREAIELARRIGVDSCIAEHNLACSLRETGAAEEAFELMRGTAMRILATRKPLDMVDAADDYVCVLLDTARFEDGARLVGAVDAMRDRLDFPRDPVQTADLALLQAGAVSALGTRWGELWAEGAELSLDEAAARVGDTPTPGIGQ